MHTEIGIALLCQDGAQNYTRMRLDQCSNLLKQKGKMLLILQCVIDAMDLLHSKSVDAFALMTSDSDFTPLVVRILESGMSAYGFGEKKTHQPFVDACSLFIFTEYLSIERDEKADAPPVQPNKKSKNELRQDTVLVKLLRTAAEQARRFPTRRQDQYPNSALYFRAWCARMKFAWHVNF